MSQAVLIMRQSTSFNLQMMIATKQMKQQKLKIVVGSQRRSKSPSSSIKESGCPGPLMRRV